MSDLLWRLHPNGGRVAVVSIPQRDSARLLSRGWLRVNGWRAVIADHEDEPLAGRVALRVCFDEPYPDPHP